MVELASTSLPPKQWNEAVRSPTRAAPWVNSRAQFNAVTRTSSPFACSAQTNEGRSGMEKLKLAAALFAAMAVVTVPARAKPPASLCRAPEVVLFTCNVGTKTVSICGREQGGAAYRFGRPGRVELEATDLHLADRGWSGGGETQVYADTPTHRYIVYNRMIRTAFGPDGLHDARITSGLLVQRGGRTVWSRECGISKVFDPFAGRFDQGLIEKLLPEGTYVDH